MEIWSNGKTINNSDAASAGFSLPYDSTGIHVGNNGSLQVHSVMQFNAMPLPWPNDPATIGRYQQAIYISNAYLKLTGQTAVCPSTQVWRANWNDGANWTNQYSGSGTNLWPSSDTTTPADGTQGITWTNPLTTIGDSTSCAGSTFTVDDTQQVSDVYYNRDTTYSLGLRPTSETSTSNNYGSFLIGNVANGASLSVNFVAEPFGVQTYAGSNNTVAVSNHNKASGEVCSTDSETPSYLPLTAEPVPLSAVIGDWNARPVGYEFFVNDWKAPPAAYHELQPNPASANGTMSGGSGVINVPSYAGSQTEPRPNPANPATATIFGSIQASNSNPNSLRDRHEYGVWAEITDTGTDQLGNELDTALTNATNLHDSSTPHAQPCWIIAALTRPNPPQISSNDFPASGQHITKDYPTVGSTGTINVTADTPTTPIDHFD